MEERRDTLGRRIPKFDRSAAAKKAQQTNKEKYGDDFHARNGVIGGHVRGRGYLGTLKDAGKTDELKALASKGGKASSRAKQENPGESQTTVRGDS